MFHRSHPTSTPRLSIPRLTPHLLRRTLPLVLALAAAPAVASVEWSGGGLNDNWTNANNWLLFDRPNGGDAVYFTGTPARTSPYVNEQYSLNSINFGEFDTFGTTSSFTINGSRELLLSAGISNLTNRSQVVNVHTQFTGNGSITNNANNGGYGYLRVNTLDVNGQTITIQPSASGIDINGRVYSNGRLVVDGPGAVSFGADNDWTGSLELKRGTVTHSRTTQLGADTNTNWIDFNAYNGHTPTLRRTGSGGGSMRPIHFVAGEGRLEVAAGIGMSWAGVQVGGGDLGKTGGGTVILSGQSARTGRTFVREGTLEVGFAHLLPDNTLEVSAGATLKYRDGMDDRVASIAGGGTIELGAAAKFLIGGTAVNDGAGTFAGSFSGLNDPEISKFGAGMLNLTGSSTQSGWLDVRQGTVLANNAGNSTSAAGTAQVTVFPGAVFGGDGRIAGTLDLYDGGTVGPSSRDTPGGGVGSLAVGTLLNRPGSTLAIQLGDGGHDAIHVAGDATLDGNLALSTVLNVALGTGPAREIIHVDGTRSATFRNITGVQMAADRSLAVTYGAHGVFVTVARPGDLTLDGRVAFADLVILAQNYGATGKSWSTGDLDGDGAAAFADLVTLAQHYGFGAANADAAHGTFAADWALAQSLVPEPTGLAAAALTSTALRRRRRVV